MGLKKIENDDWHLVVHAKGKSRRIHDLQLLLQGFKVSDLREALGLWVLLWITVVDAVHLGGFENHFGADFVGAQSCGCVGGKIGIASATSEDHDPPFLEMPYRPPPDESLGDLVHGDCALHPGRDARLLQGVL